MKCRCDTPTHKAYASYGGRGVTYCDSWRYFANFYADMGDRPPGTSLERIKNHLGYSKDNCRWATKQEQQSNMRSNRYITYDGQTLTLSEWSRKVGMSRHGLLWRLDIAKWPIERALTTPTNAG